VGVAIALAAAAGVGAQTGRGVVTDPTGRPLAGASVVNTAGDVLVTGQDGSFVVPPKTWRVVVLLDDYEPRIVPAASLGQPIVMRPTSTRPRRLPPCRPGQAGQLFDNLRIPTPDGVQVASAITDRDEGNVTVTWSRADASLRHSSGPHQTDGLPTERTMSELTDIEARDVRLPADASDEERGLVIADVRGRLPDGRRYRFIGWFSEMFEYYGLSATDAAFFDRMLDAMCYAGPFETPAQPKP
jgi:hypothetical protein